MSPRGSQVVYGICGAASDDDLLKAINQELQNIRQEWLQVRVVSISHSVATAADGQFFWTALITCEVAFAREEKTDDPSRLIDRVQEEMR